MAPVVGIKPTRRDLEARMLIITLNRQTSGGRTTRTCNVRKEPDLQSGGFTQFP